jgi:squalene-hopene/tetraprenyl-beta-curcumene cyclase
MGLLLAGCGGKAPKAAGVKADPAEAIKTGVAFMATAQNPDGSFGEKYSGVGITGVVAAAMASSPQKLTADQQQVLEKAVAYMLKFVQPDGSVQNKETGLAHYHTSLAVMALAAIDPDKHKETIANARTYLMGATFDEKSGNFTPKDWQYGGIGYDKQKGEPKPDLSNTQMVTEALHDSGLPADSEVYKRIATFLQRCQNRTESNDQPKFGNDGGAAYSPVESKAGFIKLPNGEEVYQSYGSMTYALLKSYIFCSLPKTDPRLQAAYKWIQDHYTLEENPNMKNQGLYYYHLTMARALQAYGSPTIKTPDGVEHNWSEELAAKVASLQQPGGYWVNEQDRWYEGDKALVTGYAVWTLNICEAMRKQ